MAPTRKRGASKGKAEMELGLGDLVLAKVKGFPAWPAKVSRPEDWERVPDSKKYFVQFFGTQEIAFVAPSDIQAFTLELKSKLLARCQGKTVRYFAQAVKEIGEAFEELQEKQSGGLVDNGDQKAIPSASSGDTTIENKIENAIDVGSQLERCSNMQEKSLHVAEHTVKEDATDSKDKEETSAWRERVESARGTSSSPHRVTSDVKRQFRPGLEGNKQDDSIHLGTLREEALSARQKLSKDGYKPKEGLKRKRKGSADHIEVPESSPSIKGAKTMNIVSGDSTGDLSSHTPLKKKVVSNPTTERKTVNVSEGQADSNQSGQKKSSKQDSEKHDVGVSERSAPAKRPKLVDSENDVSGLNPSDRKLAKGVDRVKAEVNLGARSAKHNVGQSYASDEDLSPLGKRRRQEHRVMSDASGDNNYLSPSKSSSASLLQNAAISKEVRSSMSPEELKSTEVPYSETEAAPNSPKKSLEVSTMDKKFTGERRGIARSISPKNAPQAVEKQDGRSFNKGLGTLDQGKTQSASAEALNMSHDKLSQASIKQNKPLSGGERSKDNPKTNSRSVETVASVKHLRQKESYMGARIEDIKKEKISSLLDVKASDPSLTMKDLIAAARNAQMQNLSHGSTVSILTPSANIQGGSLSPLSAGQPFAQGGKSKSIVVSPPSHNLPFASQNQLDSGDQEDRRHGSEHEADGGLVNGGTDAVVNRDAFEGMIETLSRTKESIGRATRLAIDCAKHGIANEVMDLLIHKLENEPSFHRRVDLFFLVDSITQCSHGQRGIAGDSYIPAVQAALPRLLSAAAPSGASARENRRQCLRVLRLWLERKILPESVLRRFMDEIGTSNDDVHSGSSLKRLSRSERGINDPIREMEGMLDEYGSNVTNPLLGLSRRENDEEEEEEDAPVVPCKQSADASTLKCASTSPDLQTGRATPSDRHHLILEDVDGELEMEDVSVHPKDEKAVTVASSGTEMQEGHWGWVANDSDEVSLRDWSPPLPLEPPPPLPPLPSSPPPPSPPPSSPSHPPHPPPPPPSLPPPPSSHLPLPSLPPPCPSQLGHLPPSLPPQGPPFPSQILSQPAAQQAQLVFQTHGNEFSSMPNGNQPIRMVVNTSQQSSSYFPDGVVAPQEAAACSSSRSSEYGSDMFTGSHEGYSKQQFQPLHPSAAQAPFRQSWPPQNPENPSQYNKSVVHHNSHLGYPHSYPSPNLPDERGRFVGEEQWKGSSAEYRADSRHRNWANGGRMPGSSRRYFGAEGYFQPSTDRPHANSKGFQISAAAGHSNGQRFPSRSNGSTRNGWRPA